MAVKVEVNGPGFVPSLISTPNPASHRNALHCHRTVPSTSSPPTPIYMNPTFPAAEPEIQQPSPAPPIDTEYDSQDDLYPDVPSSAANARPSRSKKTPQKGLKHPSSKGKAKDDSEEEETAGDGHCYLLDLPSDVLHLLLVRLPPRCLLQLGATCKLLNSMLESEAVWRRCYINRFLYDGASNSSREREELRVLVQGCKGVGGRGWKKEALSREAMIERWTASKAPNLVHMPMVVMVHSMSLSYPPNLSSSKARGVPGKLSGASGSGAASPSPSTPTPGQKLSHRQKYEAMIAVSTRPPPVLYSAGMEVGALVKSDPITGKVSKGFWGPGPDANFHLRPHWNPTPQPSAIFIPRRSQTHILWGLITGLTVHTTIQSRSHATHGGRATSDNVTSDLDDMHEGAIVAIHQPESFGTDPLKWVTGGDDGRLKYWRLNPGTGRSGKKNATDISATITCIFSSEPVEEPIVERVEEVRLRQMAHPDAIIKVACDVDRDVVCGVTEDGDLRMWFDAATSPREVRVDVGSERQLGGVRQLELSCRDTKEGVVASVLIHHRKNPMFARYDISLNSNGKETIRTTFYSTPAEAPLTALNANLLPVPDISKPPKAEQSMFARIVTPASASAGASGVTSPLLSPDPEPSKPKNEPQLGHFIMGGDDHGYAYIWEWDGVPYNDVILPMRSWFAAEGRITAVDYSCGIAATGSYDGHVDVFDPLPLEPTRLRSFRPPGHLRPGDLLVAQSDEYRARYYNTNQILLDNDLVIAAIGRSVMSWRSGTGKGRQSGKDGAGRKGGNKNHNEGGGGPGKGHLRGTRALDLRDLHDDAVDSHYEIQEENETFRPQTTEEDAQRAAMQNLGLEDGDAALEYALMMSQQDSESAAPQSSSDHDQQGGDDAEDADLQYALMLSQQEAEGQAQPSRTPQPQEPVGYEDEEDADLQYALMLSRQEAESLAEAEGRPYDDRS